MAFGRGAFGEGGSGGGEASSKITITQSSHGFDAEDVVYVQGDGTYALAQADAAATSVAVGVVESATTNSFVLITAGLITLTGKTPGAQYYLSGSTAGLLTATEPTEGDQYVPILRALSATRGIVDIGAAIEMVADPVASATLTYAAQTYVSLSSGVAFYTLDLTGNVEIVTANRAAGSERTILVAADGTERSFTFPDEWNWSTTEPETIAANATGLLKLTCFGTTDGDVAASWELLTAGTAYTVIVSDGFSGTAGVLHGRTPDGVNVPAGTWAKVSASDLYTNGFTAYGTNQFAGIDCDYADGVIDVDVALPSIDASGVGVAFRIQNSQNYTAAFIATNGGVIIRNVVANVGTDVDTAGTAGDYVAGAVHHLRVVLSGTSVTATVGAVTASATIAERTDQVTHGIFGRLESGAQRLWDNFVFKIPG